MAQQLKRSDLTFLKKGAVLGSGAFGTALATVLAKKCDQVKVWHMDAKESELINKKHENVVFLKGAPLPHNITYTANVEETFRDAEIILFVIPTQFMRGFLKANGPAMYAYIKQRNLPVVVCSKGIERSTLKFPAQILSEFFPDIHISVLAGPTFAIEVAKGMISNLTIASDTMEEARVVQRILTTPDGMFRCWASQDTVGCEVASALKNVLAIASGVAQGLGMGCNARAALITRGLIEIRDVTRALGGSGEAVFGLAGLGDLLLTCSSELSRNFSVGMKLGKGISMEEIKRTAKAVAEGVPTADSLHELGKKLKVSMPLCTEVYRIIYEKKSAAQCLKDLSKGPLRDEGLPSPFPKETTLAKL